MASSGCEDLQIVKELHQQFILLLCLRDRCGLLDLFGDFPSGTNNVRPARGGAAAEVWQRRRAADTV
jgi:transposase